jgi:hypothetical protein
MKKIVAVLAVAICVSCSKDDAVKPVVVPVDNINNGGNLTTSDIYMGFNLGGKNILLKEDLLSDSYSNNTSYQRLIGLDTYILNYEPGMYHDVTKPSIGLLLRFVSNPPENTTIKDLFKVGSVKFTQNDYDFGAGVTYSLGGEDGKYYTSEGPQTNSEFKFTQVGEVQENFCDPYKKCVLLTGTFKCRLYNQQDKSDFIDVTNGTFRIRVISFDSDL